MTRPEVAHIRVVIAGDHVVVCVCAHAKHSPTSSATPPPAPLLSACVSSRVRRCSLCKMMARESRLWMLRTLAAAPFFGLRSLRERVNRLGGTFIAPPRQNGDFVVRALVPLQETVPQ